jgi:hypothetical protein
MVLHNVVFLLFLAPALGREPQEGDYTTRSLGVVPGEPNLIQIAVINTAAPTLSLVPTSSFLSQGTYKFLPPSEIAQYGKAGKYNYGFEVDPTNGAINCTVLYRDTSSPTNAGAYAIIHVFLKDPAHPNMWGVEVNSNAHVATVTVVDALFGNSSTTDATFFIHIDPPAAL